MLQNHRAAHALRRPINFVFDAFFMRNVRYAPDSDSVNITSIGCFEDISWSRAIPNLEGQDPRLDRANCKRRTDAIEKCAFVAKQRGNKVFALQDGGMCLSSSTAHKTFQKYGTSSQCKSDGRGGKKTNHVYVIGGIKGMITLFICYL